MAKIRVYELATKLGLDNKQIVDKLNQAGIEVKNHMSALEEEVALKFETGQAGQTGQADEVKVKEERISSGLIRRRRKAVVEEEPVPEEAAEVEVAPVAPVAPEKAAPESEKVVEKKTAAVVEEPVEVAKEPVEAADKSHAATKVTAAEVPAEKVAAAVPEKKKEK
jgi:translation initiation factor IF-2